MILTWRYRIKDATTAKWLERHARAVNFVWNYCVGAQKHAQKWRQRWPSGFDLINLTAGTSRELRLHSDTIAAICLQFARSRDAKRKCPRHRGRKSLGWVPFNTVRAIKIRDDAVTYLKRRYCFWNTRPVEGDIKCGSFASDARGRWYLNLQVEVPEVDDCGVGEVGIDLGLKSLAVLTTGETIANPKHFARYESQLAIAQRANNQTRVKAIHTKIVNARRHYLHEHSRRLVRENRRIVVGNVNAARLARTDMAKSVLDAGWSTFRHQLRYKAMRHGAMYEEVDERFTTRTCSACGARSGPKGIAGLGIRQWVCDDCGVAHDRDLNAAFNILAGAERCPLDAARPLRAAEEILALSGGEGVKLCGASAQTHSTESFEWVGCARETKNYVQRRCIL